MENIPNLHILRIKYLGATDTRGSRVKITSDRFKQSIVIDFDHALNNIEDMAAVYLTLTCSDCHLKEHRPCAHRFNIVGIAEGYVITDTFQPLK